ncbi:glyoxylate/hydroxypyruvate reductase A-like [Diorhabda carinulata]|uniref:glyoxylate/hydroxypyruvate reductase A-like n=1 Tax=Diorhabda carinulata TaxID=1163345 RepID=UPI0025A1F35B|nr:glyoxylate/hydroxypyruvate reductase A-like [Diorhabda carinulata]
MISTISVLSRIKYIVPELQRILPNITFYEVNDVETDKKFRDSQVIIADFDLIAPYIYNLSQTKWVQGTWAGVEKLMEKVDKSKPPSFPISRFTGDHFGKLMSEYVVSNIVNFERRAFKIRENQMLEQWDPNNDIHNYRAIYDLTIGILGLGSIGSRVAKTLNNMGAVVYAYGRRDSIDLDEFEYVSKYFNSDNLSEILKSCDYIVNILPNTPLTKGLLNKGVLENCKNKQSVFINVGRGSIISEECLLTALKNKWISGAILDVFEEEPLRKDSALWKTPNVIITPHVAATSRAKDIAEVVKVNLQYYEANLKIPATIDFIKGILKILHLNNKL